MTKRKVYSVDLRLYATAYVVAETDDEAFEKVAALYRGGAGELLIQTTPYGDPPIYGGSFVPEMPALSLSPAMTIHGVDDGTPADMIYEFEEGPDA